VGQSESIADGMLEAERKAWESLSRYKFVMFGYWVGIWVHRNRLDGALVRNPFRELVKIAQARTKGKHKHGHHRNDAEGSDG